VGEGEEGTEGEGMGAGGGEAGTEGGGTGAGAAEEGAIDPFPQFREADLISITWPCM
jgi:hypothetical protein